MKRIKKGFTLVELLVVIAIIAILAAIIAPNAFKAIEKSKVATAESDYRAVKTATLNYYADTGAWPETNTASGISETGLFVTDKKDSGTALNTVNWNGPYLEKWPSNNPWGGKYELKTTGTTVEIDLTQVPVEAAKKIDLDLDSSNSRTDGIVTYSADTGTVTVTIEIAK